MVGVQAPSAGVVFIILGLLVSLFGTVKLAFSEQIGKYVTDNRLEKHLKPTWEKFEEEGHMGQEDPGFWVISKAIQRKTSEDRDLERVEMKDVNDDLRGSISLVFADGDEESSMRYLKGALAEYRDFHHEIGERMSVRYMLEIIGVGFGLQIMGLIIDHVLVL